MKNSIKLTALFLLLFSGAFASVPPTLKDVSPAENTIVINGLFTKIGVKISVAENLPAKALVTISDKSNHALYKGTLESKKGSSKTYNLSALENGDYNISISQNHQEIKKQIHIYDNDGQKDYFIIQ